MPKRDAPAECDLDRAKTIMEEIILAHPDTLGDIDRKLEFIEKFYNDELGGINSEQQTIGKLRLLAEQKSNFKLEEIANIQQEFQEILCLIGLEVVADSEENRAGANLKETKAEDSLIELIREWYRACLKDPNLLDDDQYIISEEWERKINLLTRRVQKLWQTISNPQREETRLDDYVLKLIQWLKIRFKQPRSQWQEPQVKMIGINHDEGYIYVEFNLNFYVDDIKLEVGKRGSRLSSQIYQEIMRHFKKTYPNWGRDKEPQARIEAIAKTQNTLPITIEQS